MTLRDNSRETSRDRYRSRSKSRSRSRNRNRNRSRTRSRSRNRSDSASDEHEHQRRRNSRREQEEIERLKQESEERLNKRIEIAENKNKKRTVWAVSPSHDHDNETFSSDKNNQYGKLRYNQSNEIDKHSGDDEKDKKKHKKKDKKKSKKHKKEKKSKKRKKEKKEKKSSADEESSSSESSVEAIEVNIDTMKTVNTSDEEEIDKMILENKKKNKQRENELKKLEEVGPTPDNLHKTIDPKAKPSDFGRALLPGEGAAMAKYVEEGKRIPRRGEIGLTSDEITQFEETGYVMSGSRHRRMEAVRLRKESQVYSADEKRALAKFNHEMRSKKEEKLMSQFRELIHSKQKTDNP